jgi:WD40 repeat protein
VLDEHSTGQAIAWSPDGRRIAAAGDDGQLLLYDVDEGTRTVARFNGLGLTARLAWHPSSSYLAVTGSATVTFVDPQLGDEIGSLPDSSASELAFAPDGTRLITAAYEGTMREWTAMDESRACEIARDALSPALLHGLLGPGRERPRCADPASAARRTPLLLVPAS